MLMFKNGSVYQFRSRFFVLSTFLVQKARYQMYYKIDSAIIYIQWSTVVQTTLWVNIFIQLDICTFIKVWFLQPNIILVDISEKALFYGVSDQCLIVIVIIMNWGSLY